MYLLILAAVIILSLILIVLGLPGLWIMVASAVVYNLVVPGDPIGWFTLVAVGVLALVAELLEFSMTGSYARKYGGSRRAGWGAIIGSIVGAMVGFPVPIVGPVIGAFVGSFLGALIAEFTGGSSAGDATRVAKGALIGRVVSTVLKIGIGFTIGIWIFIAAMK
ncbi:MAG TPA: DUF456 domain-containing protein [Gemmatimonadaceae bacterium]|jgi:uncharacterized protein YqgC (DUF456 family)|nr:DUF456 domain-containing protein [Gemmatimonadaceae bacterium]